MCDRFLKIYCRNNPFMDKERIFNFPKLMICLKTCLNPTNSQTGYNNQLNETQANTRLEISTNPPNRRRFLAPIKI